MASKENELNPPVPERCSRQHLIWQKAVSRLNNVEVKTSVASPLSVCDMFGAVTAYMRRLSVLDPLSNLKPHQYMLTPNVIKDYLNVCTTKSFWEVLIQYLQAALRRCEPELSDSISLLPWNTLESLIPFVDFLVVMSTPLDALKNCKKTIMYKTFDTASECPSFILSFLDHAWGFSHRAPDTWMFLHTDLDEVTLKMNLLTRAWNQCNLLEHHSLLIDCTRPEFTTAG